ncbi:rhodanese-like domain-containing protein [Pontibacter toksunensis]|uniref:Rhodanese-like domain-containing protein n=1 Tax=Pontibacter toksunensis TaxID=1332631 RepID=A0ABW6BT80_9BACT
MKKKLYVASAMVWLVVLKAFGQTTDSAYALMLKGMYNYSVPQLSPTELLGLLQRVKYKPLLLDTRSLQEYKVSHLSDSWFIAYDDFHVSQLKDVPKDTPIILYCSVGYRSERIGEQLQQAGYHNVKNLYGGIFEWINQGYPVYNKKGKTNQIHAYSSTWGVWLQKGGESI